ncbi:hypothetical protein BH11ACT4_BH11ACT4_15640 [soil metagenome]
MADTIDELLGASLKRIAQPGDSAGVAEAIRARLAAGDTGTPASSSGFTSGAGSWLPWIGVIVVAGIVGGATGASGLAGHPQVQQAIAGTSGAIAQHAAADACVDGPVAAELPAGERVLATARSEDSAWLGVRNPVTLLDTVWLPAGVVTVDDGQPAVASLPVGGACPTAAVAVDPPPVVAAPVAPPSSDSGSSDGGSSGGGGTPAGPSDGQAPTVTGVSATPTTVYNNQTAVVHASVSDNVGVSSVSISWSGAVSGSGSMSGSGGAWIFNFSSNDGAPSSFGSVTFQVVAYDAAGNSSAPASVTITRSYFG